MHKTTCYTVQLDTGLGSWSAAHHPVCSKKMGSTCSDSRLGSSTYRFEQPKSEKIPVPPCCL